MLLRLFHSCTHHDKQVVVMKKILHAVVTIHYIN